MFKKQNMSFGNENISSIVQNLNLRINLPLEASFLNI